MERLLSRAGFSLIEVMVAIGLLTFIIVGLLMMFQQTQRAFRAGMTQTDLLESGRSLMDMMRTEIQQAAPTHYPGFPVQGVNFYTRLSTNWASPLIQDLPGLSNPRPRRTNVIQDFYFITKQNQDWIATGYKVLFDDPNGYVGTLYRFSMTNPFRRGPFIVGDPRPLPMRGWLWTNTANASRIAEGVVHFRIRPYAQNGFPMFWNGFSTNVFYRTNSTFPGVQVVQQGWVVADVNAPDFYRECYLFRDAMPAAVELEIGLLEQKVYQRYKSIPVAVGVPPSQSPGFRYLNDRVAQIHVFRERIPLPNADLTVYK